MGAAAIFKVTLEIQWKIIGLVHWESFPRMPSLAQCNHILEVS